MVICLIFIDLGLKDINEPIVQGFLKKSMLDTPYNFLKPNCLCCLVWILLRDANPEDLHEVKQLAVSEWRSCRRSLQGPFKDTLSLKDLQVRGLRVLTGRRRALRGTARPEFLKGLDSKDWRSWELNRFQPILNIIIKLNIKPKGH